MYTRQVGAASAVALGDESEPAALSFSSHQDALNFGAHSAEYSNRCFAAGDLRLVKRYQETHLELILKLTSRADSAEYDLIFSAVPGGYWNGSLAGRSGSDGASFNLHPSGDADRDQQFMFVGVTEAVQGPDGVISSLIRIGHLEKYPFRAACESDSKNLFEFDHRERVRWGNWVSLI